MTKAIDRADLAGEIVAALADRPRLLVAVAAPPGAGKSTLAAALQSELAAVLGPGSASIVPMDGFHLDNAVLSTRGLLSRKGAPETFDAAGFLALVERLKREPDVVIPLFDRTRDVSIAGAAAIGAGHRVVLVEGNYLLLDRDPWARLAGLWDVSIRIDVPVEELERRLIQRWLDHGLAPHAARERALGNDIPNARLVLRHSREAELAVPGA